MKNLLLTSGSWKIFDTNFYRLEPDLTYLKYLRLKSYSLAPVQKSQNNHQTTLGVFSGIKNLVKNGHSQQLYQLINKSLL